MPPASPAIPADPPDGHRSQRPQHGYAYNYRDQVTRIVDALEHVTTLAYGGSSCPSCGGGADRLTAVTDAKNQTTTFEYDLAGRMTKETDPLGNVTSYGYDARGNLAALTRPAGGRLPTDDWNGSWRRRSTLMDRSQPSSMTTQGTWSMRGISTSPTPLPGTRTAG